MSGARKGIILAGGSGTRLYPLTLAVSKQLVPVYNKPMVYYPLSTLMLAGVREILVITTPHDRAAFERLLGHGGDLGLRIEYAVQDRPNGIAEAFRMGRRFIGAAPVALVLGAIEEKPAHPRSSWAVTGLYFYDAHVVEVAAGLVPSARGELEITDVNAAYLREGRLHVEKLGRGVAWLDTGTHEALLQAATFIQTIETRQGLMVACLEEIAYRMGWITGADVERIAKPMRDNAYGQYLLRLLTGEP